MYSKLLKIYKSDEPDSSGLDLEELESMAEEIRLILVGPEGLSLEDYIERAKKIPTTELGHRRIYCIKKEMKLEVYFPNEVWNILKKRCEDVEACKCTKEDDQFIIDNRGRGYDWLSKRLYMNKKDLSRKAIQLGVKVTKAMYTYTPEKVIFIRNNAHKGAKWISEQLGVSYDAIRNKCDRENINLFFKKPHRYTPEDNELPKH